MTGWNSYAADPARRWQAVARRARTLDRTLLFDESAQAIFDLNPTADAIWQGIEATLPAGGIADRVARLGASPDEAQAHVARALAGWAGMGLILPLPRSDPADAARAVDLIGNAIRITFSADLSAAVEVAVGHLAGVHDDAATTVALERAGERVDLYVDGTWAMACPGVEAPVALKGLLLSLVLARTDHALVLHAATLVTDDGATLLLGPPGRGKTTLTLTLLARGWRYGGDDVALLLDDGRCRPVPLAPAAKAGAWTLLRRDWPVIDDRPVWLRPDGQQVRYLPPGPLADGAHDVARIVFLDRTDTGAATLHRLDAVAAFEAVLADAHLASERLTPDAFSTVAAILDRAPAWRLAYADAADAAEVLGRAR